jgi:hypothetical protein
VKGHNNRVVLRRTVIALWQILVITATIAIDGIIPWCLNLRIGEG